MAKKKKAVANPARGFATTSIVSKSKLQELEESDSSKDVKVSKKNSPTPKDDPISSQPAPEREPSVEAHQQTPEELELQLERDELQLLVEKYGPKARRDSSRQVAKCQTDLRLLRAQAQPLPRDILPEQIISQILDEAKYDDKVAGLSPTDHTVGSVMEEVAISRLWTLQLTLSGLGFSTEMIQEALRAVTALGAAVDANSSVWGLSESLDFLARELEEAELPSFEAAPTKPKSSQVSSTRETPAVSRAPSPSRETSLPLRPARQQGSIGLPELGAQADVEVSDLDSDLEPDGLVTTYVETKAKLYRIRPDFVDGAGKDNSRSEREARSVGSLPLSVGTRKLQEKLERIERDPLFDAEAAHQQWLIKRIGLLRDAAVGRHRDRLSTVFNEPAEMPGSRPPSADNEADRASRESGDLSDGDSVDGDIMGAMFQAPGDDGPSQQTNPSSSEDIGVQLRRFDKAGGLHPRKVLEDTCRPRDSAVRIKYSIVSPTQYVCRHAVTISWTVPQARIDVALPPYLRLEQQGSNSKDGHISALTCTMVGVAAPDVQQSEAYIATAAMFCVFGKSVTEAKAYMKLSSVWREVYHEFEAYEKEQVDAADRETIKALRTLVEEREAQQNGEDAVATSTFADRRKPESMFTVPLRAPEAKSADPKQLKHLWQVKRSSKEYQNMLLYRQQLPIADFRKTILTAIDHSRVLILCGETGCGKSTQLPAYILDHELSQGRDCKIYCTEPRRISAITLAQRVSEELGDHRGDLGTLRSMVGYAIRLENQVSPSTRLVYATVGIVLRMLESSTDLVDLTHLVIDEVHERSIDTDFLLIILKKLLLKHQHLKVVLMSATVDATRFSKYLDDAPIVTVPGRTFPVQTFFLEDAVEFTGYANTADKRSKYEDDEDVDQSTKAIGDLQGYSVQTRNFLKEYDEYQIDNELMVRLMEYLTTEPKFKEFSKAILVFLPGIAEIRELHNTLVGHSSFAQSRVYPLHSTIASEEQQQAFEVPPAGVQKIVLATNVAETGITIPDITCVIDCGRHREMRFDEKRQISRLVQSFISRANAKQRRGRAGRVQEGLCFHLFTKYRHDEIMAEQQTPEMLRLSLQDLVMRVKICKLGDIEGTLAQALDPPAPKNVRRAIDALIEVGALTSGQDLTVLGSQLAKLPLDAMLGKLCLLSAVFGCLDLGLTIAAILSSKSPFVTPFGARQQADQARMSFAKGNSDLLTAYNAYSAWKRVSQARDQSTFAFCRKYFLSQQNLTAIEDLKGQLLSSITETGLIAPSNALSPRRQHRGSRYFVEVPSEQNTNADNETLTQSVIAWSFYPKLLTRDGKGWRNISNSQTITLHPASVNKTNTFAQYLSYYSIMQSGSNRNVNALSTTAVQELPLLLLAGDAEFKLHAGIVTIDGNRLRFSVANWKTGLALKTLREKVEEMVRCRLGSPRKELGERLRVWMEIVEKICSPKAENKEIA